MTTHDAAQATEAPTFDEIRETLAQVTRKHLEIADLMAETMAMAKENEARVKENDVRATERAKAMAKEYEAKARAMAKEHEARVKKNEAKARRRAKEHEAKARRRAKEHEARVKENEAKARRRAEENEARAREYEARARKRAEEDEARAREYEARARKRAEENEARAREYEARAKRSEAKAEKETEALRKSMEKTDRELRESNRRWKKTENLFTSQWGKLMESLVEGDLIPLLKGRGIAVERTQQRCEGSRNGEHYEFDILAVNQRDVVVVEVKTTLRSEDVTRFLSKLARFTEWIHEYEGKRILGAVAYLQSDSAVRTYAERKGLFIIRATGSSASILNAKDFQPKAFA